MGDGLVNHFWGDEYEGFSAGTRPSGYVHPLAIKAMAELGIDISENKSKSAESLRHITFDHVFTVCDNVANDCPVWLGPGSVQHKPFPDPDDATGSEVEQMIVFRDVRDGLRAMLEIELA
jgi:arsenate reductase